MLSSPDQLLVGNAIQKLLTIMSYQVLTVEAEKECEYTDYLHTKRVVRQM